MVSNVLTRKLYSLLFINVVGLERSKYEQKYLGTFVEFIANNEMILFSINVRLGSAHVTKVIFHLSCQSPELESNVASNFTFKVLLEN